MKQYIIVFFAILSLQLKFVVGQTYQIIDIDATDFPEMQARFLAYGNEYNADSLNKSDIEIYEGKHELEILKFTKPTSTVLPTSIVLVLDVSSSMQGKRFTALKQVAKEFVAMLPLDVTEVALASFNSNISLSSDFTHNINSLNTAIDKLNSSGGTNFNNAFLTPYSGAIHLASMGKNRRVIVFITDGLSEVNNDLVAEYANKDTTLISTITIALPISEKLISISKQTGGEYYSNLTSQQEISDALKTIYGNVQRNSMGYVRWKANYSCIANKTTNLKIKNNAFTFSYVIPNNRIGVIEPLNSSLLFKKGLARKTQILPIYLQGKNLELNISSITSNNPVFAYQTTRFPLTSADNELVKINALFTPADTIYATARYIIKNAGCPDVIIEAASEGNKKLLLESPNMGEVYQRGNSIPIKWKGVNKSSSVKLLYQIQGNNEWQNIGNGQYYEYQWNAPSINDSVRIQGQVSNNITLANLVNKPVVISTNEVFKTAFFSPDGKQILTVTNEGKLSNWNAKTGALNFHFEDIHPGTVAFFPDYNRVVSLSGKVLTVYTNRNGLKMTKVIQPNKSLFTSFIYINNKEYYASLFSYTSLGAFYNTLIQKKYHEITTAPKNKYGLALKSNALLVFELFEPRKKYNIKLKPSFEKALLHKTKNIALIADSKSTNLFNLAEKQSIKYLTNEKLVQIASAGEMFITKNTDSVFFNNIDTGERLKALSNKAFYTMSADNKYLAYYLNDTLKIEAINSPKNLLVQYYSSISRLQFFPNKEKLLLMSNDSLQIIDFSNNKLILKVFAESKLIKSIDIHPTEALALITTDKIVAIWDMENYFDADTSAYLKIETQEPTVSTKVEFGSVNVNSTKDEIFSNIISNKTASKLIIDSVYFEKHNSPFTLISPQAHFTLEGGNSFPVEIKFSPKTTGAFNETLVVKSGLKYYKCMVVGTGISHSITFLNPTVEFKGLKVNYQSDTLIPIAKNTGTEALIIENYYLNNTDNNNFKVSVKTNKTYYFGDTVWAKFEFSPKKRGRQNAQLYIKAKNSNDMQASQLFGNGIAKRSVVISGKTINASTNKPIAALVLLNELSTGNIIKSVKSSENGQFLLHVKSDFNYSLSASLKNYFSSSANIDLRPVQNTDTIWVNIDLNPLELNSIAKLHNIFFESGKSEILSISKPELDRLIKLLISNNKLKVEIHGHTDNIGDDKNNLLLSENRAFAVKKYLIQNKINESRIHIKSFGESKPYADNKTSEGRKANRRVEIKFVN